jgi:NADH:ubiquinone oxidoreductase subunit 2 (subunit N)
MTLEIKYVIIISIISSIILIFGILLLYKYLGNLPLSENSTIDGFLVTNHLNQQ